MTVRGATETGQRSSKALYQAKSGQHAREEQSKVEQLVWGELYRGVQYLYPKCKVASGMEVDCGFTAWGGTARKQLTRNHRNLTKAIWRR